MIKLFTYPWNWFLDALYPKRCLGCGAWGSWCCNRCLASLSFSRELHCPACGQVSAVGEFCDHCRSGHELKGLWLAQRYGNPLVRSLIKALKYDGLTDLLKPLARLLTATLKSYSLPPAWHEVPRERWLLVPVPLANKRLRSRNFNQAEALAKLVGADTGLTVAPVLERLRATKPQSELREEDKTANVHNAFGVIAGSNVSGRACIVVDDIYTSGATMEECARALKAAGALEVWGLTIAQG